jgi:hypothetical protein
MHARNSEISCCCWLFLAVIRRRCWLFLVVIFSLAAVEKPAFPGPRPDDWLFLCGINSGISEVSGDWSTKLPDKFRIS